MGQILLFLGQILMRLGQIDWLLGRSVCDSGQTDDMLELLLVTVPGKGSSGALGVQPGGVDAAK